MNGRLRTPMAFALHPQLARDCIALGDLSLCRVLLMDDARFPWVILVPRRPDIQEIYQLEEADQQQLWRESARLSARLMQSFAGDKLNVAALGNLVPQLHIHHIVRFRHDACWPAPVWGQAQAQPSSAERIDDIRGRLQALFAP